MGNKLIMESWRKFVNEEVEANEYLTEQELEEIFGKAAWEKMVDRFAVEDDGAADLARRLGLKDVDTRDASGQRLDVAQIEDKVKQALAAAQQSKDPEVIDAAQKLAVTADQAAPELDLDADADSSGESAQMPSAAELGLSKALLQRIGRDPTGGASGLSSSVLGSFRIKLANYLKSAGLPGTVNQRSPIVQAVMNVITQAAQVAMGKVTPARGMGDAPDPAPKITRRTNPTGQRMGGTPGTSSLMQNVAENIEKVFAPIIVEEVKREKARRILLEIAEKVAK
jgi:hypothetical protein